MAHLVVLVEDSTVVLEALVEVEEFANAGIKAVTLDNLGKVMGHSSVLVVVAVAVAQGMLLRKGGAIPVERREEAEKAATVDLERAAVAVAAMAIT